MAEQKHMPQPRVSVIMPTFNRRQQLPHAIDSVLRQSRPVDELVVVDDGSTDGTFEWLSEISAQTQHPRIVALRQKNGGPAAARNAGIQMASGELIAFLDDDDTWHPDKMQRQLLVMQAMPELVLLGCASDTLKMWGGSRVVDIGEWSLVCRNRFPTSSIVARRDVLIASGSFPEDMRHCEDYALWLRIVVGRKCAFLNDVLVSYSGGKPGFGHSGLSADVDALHAGELDALARWRKECNPGMVMTMLAATLAGARHLRRRIVAARRKAI
jgi:glycosyltransferase involved in cell wall biosynthesis